MHPETLAKKVNSLHSLPTIALRVNELLALPNCTSSDLERIILLDPGLTTKLLKFANSAYFGFSRTIDTLSQAITLIGQQELRNLVLATSVTTLFKGIPKNIIDMQSFWFQSVTCGVVARELAIESRINQLQRFFIIGLLHKIGKLIFLCEYPESYLVILKKTYQNDAAAIDAELHQFGFNHALLAAEILKQWQLPENIWQVILYQYIPLESKEYQKDAGILHIASQLSKAFGSYDQTYPDMNKALNSIDPTLWNSLNLNENSVQDMVLNSSLQVMDIMRIIQPGFPLV